MGAESTGNGHPPRLIWYAVVAQLLLLVYYQVIEWVDLFPWNEIRGGNGQETVDLIVGAVMLAVTVLTALRALWGMIIAVLLYGCLLWLQISSWWLPYLRGASPGWAKVYAKYFAHTTNFLPTFGNHLAPDACHGVLQILALTALIMTLLAMRETFRARWSRP